MAVYYRGGHCFRAASTDLCRQTWPNVRLCSRTRRPCTNQFTAWPSFNCASPTPALQNPFLRSPPATWHIGGFCGTNTSLYGTALAAPAGILSLVASRQLGDDPQSRTKCRDGYRGYAELQANRDERAAIEDYPTLTVKSHTLTGLSVAILDSM